MSRSVIRLLVCWAVLGGLIGISAGPASAARTPRREWSGTLSSHRGTAEVVLYPDYRGTSTVRLVDLAPSRTYQLEIYRGTCADATVLVKLPPVRTNGAGSASASANLSVEQGYAIWATAAGSSIAIRIASGSTRFCGQLQFAVATRIQIARFGIDLPIVSEPPGLFPYCNVAMYATPFSQPGETGPTFIYAHARVGMFLPLLTTSQINNGASMVGMRVRVWTDASKVYTYRIDRVLRHQYVIPAYDASVESLWIQTSEGPRGTYNKLFLVGHRIAVATAPYAASHPVAHVVVCS
jgi:hypothetical protein